MSPGRRALLLALGPLLLCAAPDARAARPKVRLVVAVSVDQLGSFYLDRYGALLDGGIPRLIQRGAYYPRATYAYANTETGPGHATLMTGAWPELHGIVGNYWFEPGTDHRVGCVVDAVDGRSPDHLLVPTFADALALATRGRARVASIAGKDRAAILMGGRRPRLALWYDPPSGRFVPARYPRHAPGSDTLAPLPAWLEPALAEHSASAAYGHTWSLLRPELDYAALAGPDDEPTEVSVPGIGRTFPRVLGKGLGPSSAEWGDSYAYSAEAAESTLALAERTAREESLGEDEVPDLLAIGLSTLDYAGHAFGPESSEAIDVLLRIDRALGVLIEALDRRVGRNAVLWLLTGDHGVTPTPEEAAGYGVAARRLDASALARAIDAALAPAKARVVDINAPRVYLAFDPASSAAARLEAARAGARAAALVPGVLAAVAAEDLSALPETLRRRFARSHHAARGPAIYVQAAPLVLIDAVDAQGRGQGTGHGSPFLYDAQVPLIIAGPGVPRGEDLRPVRMTRVAPTLSALLGIAAPAAAFDSPLSIVRAQL